MIAPRATRLWKLKSRRSDHVKVTRLWLYPELECSSCVDDCDGNGEDQLAYYCEYIRTRYPQWWESDAVPIYWSVIGDGDGFGSETAPCAANLRVTERDDILTYYYPPVDRKTGEPINWLTLPVANQRFPEFARALGWLPSPFQHTAPLRSIIRGLDVTY